MLCEILPINTNVGTAWWMQLVAFAKLASATLGPYQGLRFGTISAKSSFAPLSLYRGICHYCVFSLAVKNNTLHKLRILQECEWHKTWFYNILLSTFRPSSPRRSRLCLLSWAGWRWSYAQQPGPSDTHPCQHGPQSPRSRSPASGALNPYLCPKALWPCGLATVPWSPLLSYI